MVKNINKIYFDKNVYDTTQTEDFKFLGKKPVVLDFHAKLCGPCKILSPILEELDKEYDGKIDIYKLDIEEELEVSQMFNVMSVPTLVFIPTDGKPSIQAGAPNKDILKETVEQVADLYDKGLIDHRQARQWVEMHAGNMNGLIKKAASLAVLPEGKKAELEKANTLYACVLLKLLNT